MDARLKNCAAREPQGRCLRISMFAEERPDQPAFEVSATRPNEFSPTEYFAQQIEVSSNIILAADQNVFPAPIFYQKRHAGRKYWDK